MPQHPVPPSTLGELVDAFEETATAVLGLARGLGEGQGALPTECPGWSVHDQVSHIAALESTLAGDPQPRIEVPELAHVRSEVARFMEIGVHARRARAAADVVAELADVLPRRLATLRDPDLHLDTIIESAIGARAAGPFVALRVVDIWCHEQDIRAALGLPLALETAGAALFVSRLLDALPVIVAKAAGVPIGHTVVIEVTGPVTAMARVAVEADTQGRPRGIPVGVVGDGGPESTAAVTRITLGTEAFTRRGAGRRAVADIPYAVSGDPDVARRVLDHLAVTP